AYEGDAVIARRQRPMDGLKMPAGQPEGLRARRGVDLRGHKLSVNSPVLELVLKLVSCAAVWAGRRAGLGQLDIYPWVHGPQRGLGAGAIDRQILSLDEYGLQVCGGRRFGAHDVSWVMWHRLFDDLGALHKAAAALDLG